MRALRKIGYDYADALLLGMWNHPAYLRIMDACGRLLERGLIRHLRPGIVAFTATSWRQLLSSKKIPPGERVASAADC